MRRTLILTCALVLLGLVAQTAMAAPSLPITSPPVVNNGWTGPIQDPAAVQGQWFKNLSGQEESRPNEFYDNVLGNGGGTASFGAIKGLVTSVTTDQQTGNILSFKITASITNDTPALPPFNFGGTNSHGEQLLTNQQYVGTLFAAKLTTEFAISGLNNLPAAWVGPYRQGEAGLYPPPAYIVAENYDELGWYCWTPGNTVNLVPYGSYFVPTYDFGDIAVGQTVSRELPFGTTGVGIPVGDNRFYRIMESYNFGYDIFLNRTTDLKIGDWLDTLDLDTGQPFWSQNEYVLRGGNVSVFHDVPEPGTFVLLAVAALLSAIFGFRRMK
jgi:hypothetical protein